MGRHALALGERFRLVHEHVVGEDDRDAEREAGQSSIRAAAYAESHAEQHEDEARDRYGELLVGLHDRRVRRYPRRAHRGGLRAQLRDGQLAQAPVRPARGEQGLGVQLDPQFPEGVHLVGVRGGRIHPMALAVLEHDGNGPAVPIHADAPAFRDVDVRLIRPLHVREKDVEPSFAGAGDLLHVQHDVREVPHVEHPRPHLALGAVGLHAQENLPKPLVGVRHHGQQQVAVDRRRRGGQGQQGSEDAEQADAAGLHRHRLAIPGQPTESHQDADQQGHRYRDAERLRDEQQQQLGDLPRVHPDPNQLFRLIHDRRQQHQEREDEQGQEEGEEHLPHDITADDVRHRVRSLRFGPRRESSRPRRRRSGSAPRPRWPA